MRKFDSVARKKVWAGDDGFGDVSAATFRCIRCFYRLDAPHGAQDDVVRCPECGFVLTVGDLKFFGEELESPVPVLLLGGTPHARICGDDLGYDLGYVPYSDGPFDLPAR